MDAGDDCREFSEKGEDNMLACSTNGSNISDISPEVSLSRWGKDQLEVCSTSETERQKIQPFQDMMVKLQICCSRYTFYLDGECLNEYFEVGTFLALEVCPVKVPLTT